MFPHGWKNAGAVSLAVVSASYVGPKIASKFVGPELNTTDQAMNAVKIYGTSAAIGVAVYWLAAKILKVG